MKYNTTSPPPVPEESSVPWPDLDETSLPPPSSVPPADEDPPLPEDNSLKAPDTEHSAPQQPAEQNDTTDEDRRALEIEEKFKKINQNAFRKIKNKQNIFHERGEFSFLINVFSKEKEAMEYVENLRLKFPTWNFFFKPDRQNLRIYLGPFPTKTKAKNFIKTIPDPKPFPNYFLEKMKL